MLLRTTATAFSLAALLVIGCDDSEYDSPDLDPTTAPAVTDDPYSPADPPVQPDYTRPADPMPGETTTPTDPTPADEPASLELDAADTAPATPDTDTVEDPAVEEVPADSLPEQE